MHPRKKKPHKTCTTTCAYTDPAKASCLFHHDDDVQTRCPPFSKSPPCWPRWRKRFPGIFQTWQLLCYILLLDFSAADVDSRRGNMLLGTESKSLFPVVSSTSSLHAQSWKLNPEPCIWYPSTWWTSYGLEMTMPRVGFFSLPKILLKTASR